MKGLRVAVIGATGNVGRALVAALLTQDAEVVAIARACAHLRRPGGRIHFRSVDLEKGGRELREALQGAHCIVNVAHARFTPTIINALADPSVRLITLGSTRKFTRFPDQKAAEVLDAEAAHREGVNGIILHPAMIYGGADNNISRILRIVRWTPFVPLPQRGAALVQPIHRDDVVRCVMAAVKNQISGEPIIIAGAQAISIAQAVRVCARAAGRSVRIISIPLRGMMALAWLTRFVPGVPGVQTDEVRRLLEDKAFDIAPMKERLGVTPCALEEGLARMRAAGEIAGQDVI